MNFLLQGLGIILIYLDNFTYHLFGYERVGLPFYKVADTHFNIQGDDIYVIRKLRHWGIHLSMREIVVNIVRTSGFW